jgi:hypothetical protein
MSIAKLIKFLQENKEHVVVPPSLDTALELLQKADKKSKMTDWAPHGNYSDAQTKEMQGYIDEGYSPREAERMANAHADKTMDYMRAQKSNVNPTVPSEKMRAEMQELAKHWLRNADKLDRASADKAKNPVKYAAGKMEQAHDEATGDYKSAYNEFLSSDELKGKSGRERHKAIREWKKQYRNENPEHEEGLSNLSETQKAYEEAHKASEHSTQEKLDRILGISAGAQEEISTEDMSDAEKDFQSAQDMGPSQSAQAAAQLAGGSTAGGEDAGPTTSMVKPEAVSFGEQHKKLMTMLNEEQQEHYKRIASAKQAQSQQKQTEVPKAETAAKPKTVIRRRKPGGQ